MSIEATFSWTNIIILGVYFRKSLPNMAKRRKTTEQLTVTHEHLFEDEFII